MPARSTTTEAIVDTAIHINTHFARLAAEERTPKRDRQIADLAIATMPKLVNMLVEYELALTKAQARIAELTK